MRRRGYTVLSTLLLLCMALVMLPGTAWAADYGTASTPSASDGSSSLSVTVNGEAVMWTEAIPFIDENGRTMVPLRAVADAMGLDVNWDAAVREASFTDGSNTIIFHIDDTCARTSDGGSVQMDTAAVIVNNRTYAPIRYLAEFFRYAVGWNSGTQTVIVETADIGAEYLDKLTFLGDSTTYGLKAYGVLSGGTGTTQVWTPASGTLTLSYQSIATIVYPETGEEITITDAVERKKPEYMVITLGVNGVSFMDEENFVREYTDLVTRIQETSPGTKIILNSIYPVAASYKYLHDINNDKIRTANVWIEQIAEDTGTHFLNTFEVLVGSDGYLPESYHNGDGLHMNETSFKIILDYIKTHEYK